MITILNFRQLKKTAAFFILKLILVFNLTCTPALAEVSEPATIIINATRVEKKLEDIPAAISVVGQDKIQLGTEQLGLDESLGRVPGLFSLNRYNFAQDLRASIRGFGARSSFGIRGIKIIVDGIPETLPDGQGSVDGVDIGSARQISVIRGPASSLYGNASGGAILIESEKGDGLPFAELRLTTGEYSFNKTQVKVGGGGTGNFNYLLNVSDTSINGYRDHSEFENTQLNGRFEYSFTDDSSLMTSIHHTDQPVANDPGGINVADAAENPVQARSQNVDYAAGESLKQTRIGVLYKTSLNQGQNLEARIYNTDRDFDNKLPFESGGAVFLKRDFAGGGVKYTLERDLAGKHNRLLAGIDYDRQDDDRSRFDNLQGIIGAKTLEQNELVSSLGGFVQNETRLTDEVELTVGLRYDDITFDVTDRFVSDGDDSGKVSLDQFSPSIGISFKKSDNTRLYTTLSNAFETPTTTEFANPNGGGFNQSIEPQKSTNYEIGLKTHDQNYRFEMALFHIDVEDELTPFELATQPGRTFYQNAGSSNRDGLEISYTRQLTNSVEFSTAYTYSRFVFDHFTNADGDLFDGNKIPGIPDQLLYVDLSWFGDNGLYSAVDATYSGEFFADNANEDKIDSNLVTNLRMGYNGMFDGWELESFLGVNNLLDEVYNSNIRINAFGKRYFEPAPERNLYFGVTVRKKF